MVTSGSFNKTFSGHTKQKMERKKKKHNGITSKYGANSLKSLKNTDIMYKNGEIQEIKGFHFSKNRYRVDLDIYSGLEEEGGKSVEKRDARKLRYL